LTSGVAAAAGSLGITRTAAARTYRFINICTRPIAVAVILPVAFTVMGVAGAEVLTITGYGAAAFVVAPFGVVANTVCTARTSAILNLGGAGCATPAVAVAVLAIRDDPSGQIPVFTH